MSEHEPDRDRQEQILEAILKVVGIALAIGLVIGLGTWIVVKSLGLDDADTGGGPIQVGAPTRVALPTTALPQPTTGAPTPTQTPTDTGTVEPPTTSGPGDGDLYLNASPLFVGPMERINLTGQWPGKDSVSLLVQRFEDGEWVDFGVQVRVEIGTFETYVKTSHEGDNKFRVYDPDSETASNTVTVTIQS